MDEHELRQRGDRGCRAGQPQRAVRERGATLVEYSLLVAACALLALGGLEYLRTETHETFERVMNDVGAPPATDATTAPVPTTPTTTPTTTTPTTTPTTSSPTTSTTRPCRRRCPH